jgi:hypothetical protein
VIVLFTDFGWNGPYVGQMKAAIARVAPSVPVIDLLHDAPAHEPRLAAYLLASFVGEFPPGSVFAGVVDPGVGSARAPLAVAVDGRWLVGPDNGLFEPALRRAKLAHAWRIDWRPERLSSTFHGRDLFAPVAARLALGQKPPGPALALETLRRPDWPDDLAAVVYIDRFGNCMSGLRAGVLPRAARLQVGGREIAFAETFSEVAEGAPFWFENSNGLIEIAVNQGRADQALGLGLGSPVTLA